MDSNSETKKYAVVEFLSDSTFSEVPTNWLIKNGDDFQCWWPPRASNNAMLIAYAINPNFKLWKKYDVNVIKYCSSFESARKSASDANYITTDEERLGRGKRQHVYFQPYSSSEENEELGECEKIRRTKKNRFQSDPLSRPPSCPDDLELCQDIVQDENISGDNVTFTQNKESRVQSASKEMNLSTIHDYRRSVQIPDVHISLQDVPIIIEDCASQLTHVQTDENWNMKENFKELKRMLAANNVTLKDTVERLKKIEDTIRSRTLQQPLENDDSFIFPFFPLSTIQNIKDFENILTTVEEAATQFKIFLMKIGGHNPRDNIHRILKNIYINKCAMDCSWKGKRDNFKICDLKMIKIIKREVISRHMTLTEAEFETIVAEWLRFAKQRKGRDDKKNGPSVNIDEQR